MKQPLGRIEGGNAGFLFSTTGKQFIQLEERDPGIVHGATDELDYPAVEGIVHVRDLHATLLHQFGIDHTRFTRKLYGLDYKLTGVEPTKAVAGIIA